ncbi:hypothetical protein PFTANZ_06433 [Plasmodium falciparum Tanzania (2000708)]|uniref:Uncharacterized protein n=1 Tax=Plasmodium falciparum Tanzania (2000708) TaxID=1036725 RepID=A0A024VWN8_PLAFA|nr:hypothetical protein PFTANZ_06433 [Plasmodium falciparum Tanzania (2000708)]
MAAIAQKLLEQKVNNQRKQFLKQKRKYETEISVGGASGSGSRRKTRSAGGTTATNYEEYEKKFYEKFKGKCGTVGEFLGLLNNEKACENIKDDKEGRIDFKTVNSGSTNGDGDSGTNDKTKGTFYRSDYCQPCPICGMKKKRNGDSGWEKKNDNCTRGNLYEPKNEGGGTTITILKSGENHDDIKQKIEDFCTKTKNGTGDSNSDSSLYDPWKCYEAKHVKKVKDDKNGEEEDEDEVEEEEDLKNAGGLCILEKTNSEENVNKQKTFNDFFYYWVAHMLKDSIHWRTKKIKGCLSNGAKIRCRNNEKCKTDCGCFEKWVEKKETEWTNIKEHFGKQEGIVQENVFMKLTHDDVLEGVLKDEFYKDNSENNSEGKSENSLDAEDAEELKHIRDIIEKKNQEPAVASDGKKKTIMDKLLAHELTDAQNCLKKHKDNDCKQAQDSAGRFRRPRGR